MTMFQNKFADLCGKHPSHEPARAKEDDTIAAIGTAFGAGGIGIVRLSGQRSLEIGRALFRTGHSQGRPTSGARFLPHHLHYGHIVDPGNHRLIDEVLLAFMPAPRSYTREDVIEIHCHGGPAVLQKIMVLVIEMGARLAEPGEFTRRAFLNGRIDLSQAEAVADLISASNEGALQMAAQQLSGGLKRRMNDLIDEIDEICAEIEAGIEFPEETEALADHGLFRQRILKQLIQPIEELIVNFQARRILREGFRIAIAGRPNVGKSSLFNRLIAQDKAIVTPVPGTTRDPVEAKIFYKGVGLVLSDTAGIRRGGDPIEEIGIRKSKDTFDAADLVLVLVDATEPNCGEDLDVIESIQNQPLLLVVNKIDLAQEKHPPEWYLGRDNSKVLYVSAREGSGVDELKNAIVAFCPDDQLAHIYEAGISDLRHKLCLEDALRDLMRAMEGCAQRLSDELVCLDLKNAGNSLRKITGQRIETDTLDRIFERFCIGK